MLVCWKWIRNAYRSKNRVYEAKQNKKNLERNRKTKNHETLLHLAFNCYSEMKKWMENCWLIVLIRVEVVLSLFSFSVSVSHIQPNIYIYIMVVCLIAQKLRFECVDCFTHSNIMIVIQWMVWWRVLPFWWLNEKEKQKIDGRTIFSVWFKSSERQHTTVLVIKRPLTFVSLSTLFHHHNLLVNVTQFAM